ncbi:hypothetical protein F5882DRAFT_373664 [Hyaloscypha sp. PMI_1271]|nr:hypothetical protein F5882DRAFT_373664 [Hyaloscypha sp. PMI_1271]
MKLPSSSNLVSYGKHMPQLDHKQQTSSPIHDPECGKEVPKARYRPPSVFHILSLGILFLSITAAVAGAISGDREASFCVIAALLILEAWMYLEKVKLQEMKRSRFEYRGRNIGLEMNPRGINRLLYAWVGIGADGALLG